MGAWMAGEVVRSGGVDTTSVSDLLHHVHTNTYRGFLLRWLENDGALHVARVVGFDRWANSRPYEGANSK